MASEVLSPNSSFSCNKDIINYVDHLYENHILDDEEPEYENNNIIRKILQKSNGFSKSLVAIHEEALNTKAKEENIYENIGFIEDVIKSIDNAETKKPTTTKYVVPQPPERERVMNTLNMVVNKEKDNSENRFTSTFSLTIGKPLSVALDEERTESGVLSIDVQSPSQSPEGDDSDDGSFKSSYAKSLIDSLRKINTSSQTSPGNEIQSHLPSPPILKEEMKPLITFDHRRTKGSPTRSQLPSRNSVPKTTEVANAKTLEQLEKRVTSLTDNVLTKDREMEKLRQEMMMLKLECNRVKAENRNLKVVSLSNGGHGPQPRTSSPYHSTGGDSQLSSLSSSLAPESDTWTLQQQVLALNAQLEKAELSRRAYEAATRQLVHFLQTINTTLSTVAGPDAKVESPFTPHNTSELLTNLELSLLHNRSRSGSSPRLPKLSHRDPSFPDLREGASSARTGGDRGSKARNRKGRSPPLPRENRLSLGSSNAPLSISSSSSQDSTKQTKEPPGDRVLTPSPSKEARGRKRTSPERRFSISQKVWSPSNKKPLMRSGSVSNLPSSSSLDSRPIPRVSRAVSTHCVATNKINTFAHTQCPDGDAGSDTGSNSSNRMLTAKAKDFFSSLRNIFKHEGDRSSPGGSPRPPQPHPTPHVDASTNTKKKLTLPSFPRSSKVKLSNQPVSAVKPSSLHPSPALSLPPETLTAQKTPLKKKHSFLKSQSMPRVSLHHPDSASCGMNGGRSSSTSVFYVSCFGDGEDGGADAPEEGDGAATEGGRGRAVTTPSGSSSGGVSSPSPPPLGPAPPEGEEELSGPQELSMALSLQGHPQDETPDPLGTPPSQESSGYVQRITIGSRPQDDCVTSSSPSGTPWHQSQSAVVSLEGGSIPDRGAETNASLLHLATGGGLDAIACQDEESRVSRWFSIPLGEPRSVDTSPKITQAKIARVGRDKACNFRDLSEGRVSEKWELATGRNRLSELRRVCSLDPQGSNTIYRHRSAYGVHDAVGLRHSLWKIARESHRASGCKVVFV